MRAKEWISYLVNARACVFAENVFASLACHFFLMEILFSAGFASGKWTPDPYRPDQQASGHWEEGRNPERQGRRRKERLTLKDFR